MLDFLGEFALPFDKLVHLIITHRLAELEVDLLIFLQDIHNLLDTLLNDFQYSLLRIHLRLLLQISHTVSRSPDNLTLIALLDSGDDFHQCRFTGTIETDYTDLRPVKER